jgi:outer membrane protein
MNTWLIRAALTGVSMLACSAPAHAEAGDWIIRGRAIMVAPTEQSSSILPGFPGEEVSVNDAFMPEVDFTYMLADNVGVEAIVSSTKHSASGKTGVTGGIGKLASTWVLPPTVTVQYHFAPNAKFRPYVGAGVNYTIFYSENASSGLEAAVGPTSVRMSDSFGWAAQAGVDIDLSEKMFLNLDVKYIDMDTTARLTTTSAGVQTVEVDLDPLVVGVGVGMRF